MCWARVLNVSESGVERGAVVYLIVISPDKHFISTAFLRIHNHFFPKKLMISPFPFFAPAFAPAAVF